MEKVIFDGDFVRLNGKEYQIEESGLSESYIVIDGNKVSIDTLQTKEEI